jgi:protein-tyrosine phosphatase
MRRVLFICTGNYYRSRFAEAVFNHHARAVGLPWQATSRGLALQLNHGDLSPFTVEALTTRGIDLAHTGTVRVRICEDDLQGSDLCIALCETEHRPMVQSQFAAWEPKVQFWSVADVPFTQPNEALPRIEEAVLALVAQLSAAPNVEGPSDQ